MGLYDNTYYHPKHWFLELRRWKFKVMKRDEYKCVICGSDKGVNAYLKEPHQGDISAKLKVDNGRTLCLECHRDEILVLKARQLGLTGMRAAEPKHVLRKAQ